MKIGLKSPVSPPPGIRLSSLVALAYLAIFFVSCSKHDTTPTGNGCISRIVASSVSTAPPDQLDSIGILFRQNNLSTAGLQFTAFFVDTVVEPGYSGIQEQVQARQFINNLPIFYNGAFFNFNLGIYQPEDSYLYSGAPPGTDTTVRQTLTTLRNAYLAHYQQAVIEGGVLNSKPSYPSPTYGDSCLLAELGYFDPAYFSPNTTHFGAGLVLAWKVTPLSGGYPTVYVQDSNDSCWAASLIFP